MVSQRRAGLRWLPVLGSLLGLALAVVGVTVLRSREPAEPSPSRAADPETERLRALGYVGYVHDDVDPERDGVTRHDPARAQPGVNVYCSAHGSEVFFLDMQGSILHRLVTPAAKQGADCLLEPYDGASFLALNAPRLSRLDWNSSRLWTSADGHHHDVAVGAEGRIYTLSERRGWLSHESRRLPVQDHAVSVLSPRGQIERTIPLLPLFADRIARERLARMIELLAGGGSSGAEYQRESDVLHPNTIELLARDLSVAPAGSALLCLRELDLVAIVDLEAGKVLWSWGPGELDRPHHPSVLDDGTLLIFDNGTRRGSSRVIQVDPATQRIVWQYAGNPPESFFSDVRGSAQALPSGNVLVTESMRGRVFEVTRAGDVVWEFLNPERGPTRERKQIYRMYRISAGQFAEFGRSAEARGSAHEQTR